MTIASHLNFGAEKFGIASQDAVLTLEKSTIPQITAATYPAMIAIRIGITAKNLRNTTDPSTATPKVTRNTITFFGSITSSFNPALDAAVPASSRPISATTGPMAAGGSTTWIQSDPNL